MFTIKMLCDTIYEVITSKNADYRIIISAKVITK